MQLSSLTPRKIIEAVNMKPWSVNDKIEVLTEMEKFHKTYKVSVAHLEIRLRVDFIIFL